VVCACAGAGNNNKQLKKRMRKSNLLKSLLLTASLAWLGTSAEAAIPVGAGGAGPLTFGTAPVQADFAGAVLRGVATTFADATTLDAAVQTIDVSSNFFSALLTVAEAAPSTHAGAFRYNSTGRYLQARPTTGGTNAASVLLGTFQNTSGGDLPNLSLSYDFAVFSPLAGELPGFNVYYSLTGLPGSWTVIPSLTQTEVGGNQSAALSLGSWPNSALLYVLWVDDNANAISDPGYTIDNLSISLPGIPPSISQQPVATTVAERQIATLSVSAAGSPPLSFQWFKDGNAISTANNPTATSSTLTVTNTLPSGRANSVPSDSGMYYVVVTGSTAPPATSATVQVTVNPDTNAPAFRYALCPSPMTVTVILSEPVQAAYQGDTIDDNFSWNIEKVSGPGLDVGVATITYAGGMTITLDLVEALDPATSYRAVLVNAFPDFAVTPNLLPAPSYAPLYCFTNDLLALNATWRYNDDDVDPGPMWIDVGFDDSAAPWATGAGPFDAKRNAGGAGINCRTGPILHDLGNIGTCINLESPVTMTNLITAYFRTHFNFSGTPSSVAILLRGKADDGKRVYLNGVEVWRLGLPAGTVTHTTFATRTVGDGDAQDSILLFAPPSLVNGDNVIAVEAHQVNITSSDFTMGMSVSVLQTTLPVVSPVVTIEMIGTDVKLTWSGGGTLICTDDITLPRASWTVVAAATSPHVTPATGAFKFYAIRIP